MIFPSQLGSTLLRTQKLQLPQAFRRYKSITAAIERGRQDGPDRPFRPRTQAPPANGEEGGGKTRAQLRFERFGPSSDGRVYTEKPQQEHRGERSSRGPNTDPHSISVDQDGKTRSSGGDRNFKPRGSGGDRDFKPRSSRFGRVGPPGDAPSRFTEAREEMPSRDRDAFSGRREDPFDRTGNKSDRSSRPSYQSNDRAPRGDRYERGDRPPRREGKFDRGDRFPRREGQFDRGDRTPPREGQFDTPRQKPYNGAYKSDYQHVHFDRASTGPKMETSGPGDEEGGAERPERSQRLFNRTDATTPYASRPGRFQTDRPREFSRRPYDAPDGATGTISTQGMSERGPDSLPYSTAASEFIYGFSSVVAAMRANRRKIYTIYVHSRGASRDNLLTRIRALKLFPITREVGDEYLRAMDKASSGRPHNGVILESSPLPVPPITELKSTSIEDASFTVAVDSQTAEDALVNGKQELYSYKSAGWRHPLILYVDGVLDEGNLGAIARSAYFLGVDAIVTPTRQVAPWSHIALKASAGAAEAIPIFKAGEPTDFLGKSARAGWRIYASASVPPPPPSTAADEQDNTSSNIVYTIARSTKRLPADHCPVAEHPTILMMGAEGFGLRESLLNVAHYQVGIKHGREVDEVGVDSLNVSAAASLLCNHILQRPVSKPAVNPEEVLF